MIAVLGLSISMMMPRISPVDLHLPVARQEEILNTMVPSFRCIDEDAVMIIKRLFAIYHVPVLISPDIKGRITLDMKRSKFELVLQNICNQAEATYRYEDSIFYIIKRDPAISVEDAQNSLTAAQAILDKVIPSFECKDVTPRAAIEKLFAGTHQKVWMEPLIDLRSKITVKKENQTFEILLQTILNETGFTYRYESGTFWIIYRGEHFMVGPEDKFPEFVPATFTSSFRIRNESLFLSPKKTRQGTLDLLQEATQIAQQRNGRPWTYGQSGLALELALEAIDKQGGPMPGKARFQHQMAYLPEFGIQRMNDLFAKSYQIEDKDFRLIIVASAEPTKAALRRKTFLLKNWGEVLPQSIQYLKWKTPPTVTAYVYEFRRQKGSRLATLLKPGQSKISARKHLVLAGLWTEKELGR